VLVGIAQVQPDAALLDRRQELVAADIARGAAAPRRGVGQIASHGVDTELIARIAVQHARQAFVGEHRPFGQRMVKRQAAMAEGRLVL